MFGNFRMVDEELYANIYFDMTEGLTVLPTQVDQFLNWSTIISHFIEFGPLRKFNDPSGPESVDELDNADRKHINNASTALGIDYKVGK